MGSCFSSKIKTDSPLHNGSRIEADSPLQNVSVPSTPRTEGEVFLDPTLKSFSFNELKKATRHFSSVNTSRNQEGHYASVSTGLVNGNSLTAANPGSGGTAMVVAVKRFRKECHMIWLKEINYVRRLHHPNLLKLIGYCSEDDERLLVYEFMPCGRLDRNLFRGGSNSQPLSWTVRMKIALGVAKVLAFFHSDEAKVIYRYIHCSNILLDSDYNAKLCNLGLATRTHGYSRKIKGTLGYAAPEYVATGDLSSKCDVYGFGVVMLEMMTGRRALDRNRPSKEFNLVEWAKPYLANKRRVRDIIDPGLKGAYSAVRAWKAASLALCCVSEGPMGRPNMNDVVKVLEQLQEPSDMDGPRPSQNEPSQIPHAISSI